MGFENLKFKIIESDKTGKVGLLTLSRPEALNALNKQTIGELSQFFSTIGETTIRCLVVTGEGKSFVAGADIKEMENYNRVQALEMAQTGQKLFTQIEDCPIPTIACVNGFALGGGLELAMSCDFMLASKKAKIGLPEVTLGLIPGYGGTQRLARYIGKGLAKRITLSGDLFSAQQAYDWGLIAELFEPEELLDGAIKIAGVIASRSPVAISLAKQSVRRGFDTDQQAGMNIEAELFSKIFTTKDCKEGISAFIEKRRPKFTGE